MLLLFRLVDHKPLGLLPLSQDDKPGVTQDQTDECPLLVLDQRDSGAAVAPSLLVCVF
jgi:hypothetical protein